MNDQADVPKATPTLEQLLTVFLDKHTHKQLKAALVLHSSAKEVPLASEYDFVKWTLPTNKADASSYNKTPSYSLCGHDAIMLYDDWSIDIISFLEKGSSPEVKEDLLDRSLDIISLFKFPTHASRSVILEFSTTVGIEAVHPYPTSAVRNILYCAGKREGFPKEQVGNQGVINYYSFLKQLSALASDVKREYAIGDFAVLS